MSTARATRTIRLEPMTRVEGEGGIRIDIQDGRLTDVKLNIYEPPRFFEAFLRGRSLREVPDLVARICGICPVAHQLTAARAIEAALGITPGPEVRALRLLLYCAEWIGSHALHIYLLQMPDFFGKESAIALAQEEPELVERGLEIRKAANDLTTVIGGRAVHPLAARVGGFWKAPRRTELLQLRPQLEAALAASLRTAQFVSTLEWPDLRPEYECVALSEPAAYAILDGHIVSSGGLDVSAGAFEQIWLEEHVVHSTALHSVRAENGASYLVGPLARLSLNYNRLLPRARRVAEETRSAWQNLNPHAGIVARAIEIVECCERCLRLIDEYRPPEPAYVEFDTHGGEGCATTEAPRGLLFHRYRIDDAGLVQTARIVPPTAQNCRRIEDDLHLLVAGMLDRADEEIVKHCERLVRSYDPCISCATHVLRVRLQRK